MQGNYKHIYIYIELINIIHHPDIYQDRFKQILAKVPLLLYKVARLMKMFLAIDRVSLLAAAASKGGGSMHCHLLLSRSGRSLVRQ